MRSASRLVDFQTNHQEVKQAYRQRSNQHPYISDNVFCFCPSAGYISSRYSFFTTSTTVAIDYLLPTGTIKIAHLNRIVIEI